MAWTLVQFRENPELFKQYKHYEKVPCVCGWCGDIFSKPKVGIYHALQKLEQDHLFCSRSCAHKKPTYEGRVCKTCGVWVEKRKLRDQRGWCCISCFHLKPQSRYLSYTGRAKTANLHFDLTYEQFMMFWQKPCHYCDAEIATIGLDRVNNHIGYTVDNVVPCCKYCNAFKSNQTQEDFVALCTKIAKQHGAT